MNGTGDNDPVGDLLSKLRHVKRATPNRWMAQCPAHNDDTNSLQVTRADDGRALVKCFANCATESVLAAVGMRMGDLFVQDKSTDNIIATYDYRDEAGTLVYQSVRRFPKKFVQRRPDGKGGWLYDLHGVNPLLYRLPELLSADPSRTVFVVEGEKDADRLSLYKVIATTNSAGAGKWTDAHSAYLRGRTVVIIPDNDKPGRDHAAQVADSLRDVAASVKVVQLPAILEKGDISDWLDARHKLTELKPLIDAAPEWVRGSVVEPVASEEPTRHKWEPVPLPDLQAPEHDFEWLWRGYVAKGMVTLFSGLWKSGKTTLLSHLYKALDGSDDTLGGQDVGRGKVLVVSEENPLHWVRRREEYALGANVSVICEPFMVSPSNDEWGALVQYVAEQAAKQEFALVVFDSIVNLWSVKNENDAPEVKAALMGLKIIKDTGAGILLVSHHSKMDQGEFKGTRGSGAFMGIADILMEYRRLSPDDDTDTRRVIKGGGRFMDETPHERVLQYLAGFGFESLGTRADTFKADRAATLMMLLPDSAPGFTVAEVLADWPTNEHRPSRASLEYDLRQMARDGVEVLTSGSGSHARYWRSVANKQWAR